MKTPIKQSKLKKKDHYGGLGYIRNTWGWRIRVKPFPPYNILTNHRTVTQYRRYIIRPRLTKEILEKAINELLSRPSRLDRILDQISKDLESERENKEKENDKT